MSRAMIQAAVTMNQLQQKMDLIGNNLANSQTTGYKAKNAEFASLLFQQINNMNDPNNDVGRLTPGGVRVGSGAKLGSTNIDLTPGALKETGRALDLALLEPNHLFQVSVTENNVTETRYTRDGAFYLSPLENNQVMLTTSDGHPVLGVNGQITFADGFDSLHVADNGFITVQRGNNTEVVGQLAVIEAVRPRVLEAAGANQYRLPNLADLGLNQADVIQAVPASLTSGTLEMSNVNMGKELTDLITAQRAYQFNARTISMGDQMMGLVNQLRT
ncbi:flagellar hook-basal body protein [Ornithinibacillus halotolerans]|uniref:Flagellar hook-basal body complex protein FlhP n=1 Tax=Ornithinibacillus halotolerans TaxID=1274357 RepID=A0A916W416_9BACI|nr:flagellar hook-basal body protein [Ornithinibacillus halotolerans]GGA64504.1 flagellar hook-basal body complex protein FlhP [Ornithinibacillus halotolerans]